MVKESILRGLSSGLKSSEKRFFGSEDLNSRGGVLSEVRQATGVGDESSGNNISNKDADIGGKHLHLVPEVDMELGSVLDQIIDLVTEELDIEKIDFINVRSHGGSSGVADLLGQVGFNDDFLNLGKELLFIVEEILSGLNELDDLDVNRVVGNNAGELGEVPSEPLLDSHAETVDVLVELVDQGNGLDNGLVLSVDVEHALATGVAVTETKLGSDEVFFGNAEVLVNVVSYGSHNFVDELADLDVNSEFFVDSIRGRVICN